VFGLGVKAMEGFQAAGRSMEGIVWEKLKLRHLHWRLRILPILETLAPLPHPLPVCSKQPDRLHPDGAVADAALWKLANQSRRWLINVRRIAGKYIA
jgi:hypothetical protein